MWYQNWRWRRLLLVRIRLLLAGICLLLEGVCLMIAKIRSPLLQENTFAVCRDTFAADRTRLLLIGTRLLLIGTRLLLIGTRLLLGHAFIITSLVIALLLCVVCVGLKFKNALTRSMSWRPCILVHTLVVKQKHSDRFFAGTYFQ